MAEKEQVSVGFRAFLFGVEILILTAILGGAWIIDKLLVAPPLIIAFRLVRLKIETKFDIFHMATIFGCMIVSTSICLFGLYLSLPSTVSFVSSIIIGGGFALITLYIQDILNLKAKHIEIKKELESLKSNLANDENFDVDNCTEQQLIKRCRELKMSRDATELAIEFFVRKTKQSVIADKMCIEEKSVQQQKRRLRKKLNK